MPKLKLEKIKFGDPGHYHFVSFSSGEHSTEIIEDRHDIDIEVLVPASTDLSHVEEIARKKAQRFIKELAESL